MSRGGQIDDMVVRGEWPTHAAAARLTAIDPVEVPEVSARSRAVMRTVDVIVAAAMLIVLLPVVVTIGVLIAATGRGAVLYRQQRVGMSGETFTVLKFRTMAQGTHEQVLADPELRAVYERNDYKLPGDDPRITRIGRPLRRTSLDELPQLVNVLRGEMSLVGVRPLLAQELHARSPYDQAAYFNHKPGLTGLWQISGRSKVLDADRCDLDRQFLDGWSLRQNLVILVKTPLVVLAGSGAH